MACVLRKREHLTSSKQFTITPFLTQGSKALRTTGQGKVASAFECPLREVVLKRRPCWRAHYFSACSRRPLFPLMLFVLLQLSPMLQAPICVDKLP